jgi:hypothetical protein
MAMEIEAGRWLFTKPPRGFKKKALPLFLHTPLQDLECLLWMIVWTLDNRFLDPRELYTWQQEHFWEVFADYGRKHMFLQDPNIDEWLEPAVKTHPELSDIPEYIYDLVMCIGGAHEQFKQAPGYCDRSAYSDDETPRAVLKCMENICKALRQPVLLYPEPSGHVQSLATPVDKEWRPPKHKLDTKPAQPGAPKCLKVDLQPHGDCQRQGKQHGEEGQ